MRIDLGSQSLELSLARQNLVLQRKPLRFPGGLKAPYYVVHGDRKVEKEDSNAEQQWDFSVIALIESGEVRDEREQEDIEFARQNPPGAGKKSRDGMNSEESHKTGAPKGERTAEVPAGKTDKRILGRQRECDRDGLRPGEASREGQQGGKKARHREPCSQVNSKTSLLRGNGVHV